MKWILMFRRATDTGNGRICQTAECTMAELPGVKEKMAMELEKNSGEAWICTVIVPMAGRTP